MATRRPRVTVAENDDAPQPLHILKLAVGVSTLDELRQARARNLRVRGGSWVPTRNFPRRAEEVLAGGSVYWVIRGQIQARQRITGFSTAHDDKERPYCRIEVDTSLVPTLWRAWRPFQGWRYLTIADAPLDASAGYEGGEGGALPEKMLTELRALGLI
jgi:hypothetical protein